ncbi:glycosyltransferase family 4 protein [Aestuariivivens sediminicola]|uniref:glycosyltransferase family 4 protein n=1 Tax=Aestuariivivens sediminicola TaxID=2913560 RepID=UPI001F55E772|nr:glycosyltransferase family 4 protein [Aestuariivivens sediminicola]
MYPSLLSKKILIIGSVWPEPKSSAAGSRMLQLIETFLSLNYRVIFASASTKTTNSFNLEDLGVTQQAIKLNHSSFDTFIKPLNPHIVMFDRFMTEEQFGWRVATCCPNALRILDTEDLHGLRKGRQQAHKEGKPFSLKYLFNDTSKREIASILRSDLSLIISEAEMEILKNHFNVEDQLLCYLPFMMDRISDVEIKNLPKYSERDHFIFIGNFLHDPNYHAALYLKKHIWPLIKRKLPKSELHIYGAYISGKVQQLHNEKEGFMVKGFIEDFSHVMKNTRVALVPLSYGAGLKGKIVDAMINGTPNIMTPIAAEGMFGDMRHCGFIEDSPEQFAHMAIQLFESESIWNDCQSHGFEVINKRFLKSHHQKKFSELLNQALLDIEINRENNFIGQLLQHQTMQSTKYMSLWIEEKNRNQIN